ncbi:MAG: HAMP domain-containing histidine kinase, partial [Epsilonproteobacteria bacterium]|nr:HAMP domain-containing histidine kinase [Campylobacterota bacterium]
STKEQKDGTGLGLYMSKTIIQEHCHGILSVKNIKDGALFKISIKESKNDL